MATMVDEAAADEPSRREDEPTPAAGQGRSRRVIRAAIAIAATAAIIAVLVWRFGAGLGQALAGARPAWVALAVVMSTAGVLLGALRWQIVIEAMHYRLGFGRSLVAVLATWPLAVVTPSRANDLLRAWVVRRTVPLAAGTGSVLAEKFVDMSWLLAMSAAGAAIESLWIWAAAIAGALAVEIAAVAVLVSHRRTFASWPVFRKHAQKIEDFFVAFDALFASPLRLAAACLVSLVIRGLTLGITYALLRAVDADVGLVDTCALWPVATLIGLVPVTLAGMGTRDATFMYLLGTRGHVTHAAVLAATLGYSAIAVGLFAIVGVPVMIRESGGALRGRKRGDAA
jgi:uncharacterized protein (TIRG00374 family)